jgi:hypothetical protein
MTTIKQLDAAVAKATGKVSQPQTVRAALIALKGVPKR